MNNRNAVFVGAALLIAGLFTPIVRLPIVGSVSLFGSGTNLIAIDILLIAVIAVAIVIKSDARNSLWPGIAASGVLLYEFAALQYRLSQMRENLGKDLRDNPFAGIAQGALSAVQIEWGWLVLAAGAGFLVYAGLSAPRDEGRPRFDLNERSSQVIAAVSALFLLFAPGWDLLNKDQDPSVDSVTTSSIRPGTDASNSLAPTTSADAPSAEEADYVKQNLRLYDLRAKYYDSILDGRVSGVDFKIQNNGNRTLNKVTVRVVFYDANGNAISEQEYNPVIVSDYSIGDNTPLRPHYIWQQESDQFYEAKNVPSEWAEGKVNATITEIEFAPNG